MPELQITEADRKRLVHDAERIVRSHEDAEDVVQGVMLRAWAHRERFRGESSSLTYLRAGVRNGCIQFLRDRKVHIELDAMPHPENIAAVMPHVAEQMDARAQLSHAFRSYVKHKGARYARKHMAIVILRAQGMTHEEIAREMRTTTNYSKTIVRRFKLVLLRVGERAA